ncbi:MAG: hypothetical protein ACYTEX_21550 [Planctomycetota bacterium]|jgi:acyl-CoA hydrolase
MPEFDWKETYNEKVGTAPAAMKLIKSGDSIFIGTGCGQPQHLVSALVEHCGHVHDAHIVHLLTMGAAPYADTKFHDKFKMNSFFIADNVRDALKQGIGDYTPMFLSEIPHEFEAGRLPVDVALITVTPPDVNGLCSLGVSVDIVKSAAANARYVIAQVNANMPRTFGDSFVHVNSIDMLVPHDEEVVVIPVPEPDETLAGRNVTSDWTERGKACRGRKHHRVRYRTHSPGAGRVPQRQEGPRRSYRDVQRLDH